MPKPSVTFGSHVASAAVSPLRFSAEEKGKGTTWKQDLISAVESDIADATIEDNQELEIACLVSLWHNQEDSDTANDNMGHEDVVGRLVMESQHQEFWE